MGMRGPHSAEAVSQTENNDAVNDKDINEGEEEKKHIQPYDDMGDGEKQMWIELITDFPPGAHNECDRPLLRSYIEAIIDYKNTREVADVTEYFVENPNTRVPSPHPIHKLVDMHRKTIASLAIKLRMAPSGRQNTYYESVNNGMKSSENKPKRPRGRPKLAKK